MLFFTIKYAQYHDSGYPIRIQVSENCSKPTANCVLEHCFPKQELIIVPQPGKKILMIAKIHEQGEGTTGTCRIESHTYLSISLTPRTCCF